MDNAEKLGLWIRITLYADPDPFFHLNVDLDLTFHFNADPAPHQSDSNLRPLV